MSVMMVAKLAQVPYSTAWRVINRKANVSAEAVEKVMRAARQIGYDPTQNRRGRRPKSADGIRTHNIALLHLRGNTSLSLSVVRIVEHLLSARSLNLIVRHVDNADDLPQAVRAGNIDGILGYGQFLTEAISPRLLRIPAVWMMTRFDNNADTWGDRVQPDHRSIGRMAADYLLDQGCSHLAFVGAESLLNSPVVTDRWYSFCGYAQSRAKAVHLITGSLSSQEDPNLQSRVDEMARQIAQTRPLPTGIFGSADRITRLLQPALERHGIRAGRDVQIVSCDNESEILAELNPRPPSIDLNRKEIARQAVERLFWRMRHGMESPAVITSVTPRLAVTPQASPAEVPFVSSGEMYISQPV